MVDRLKLHSALGIAVNSVGVPKLASAVRLLQENPELTADRIADTAPAALDDPAAAREWLECVAENHLFFAGEPLRRRRDATDDGAAAGAEGSESDSDEEEAAATGREAGESDDARALRLRRESSEGASGSDRPDRDAAQLAAFVAENTATGRIPDFSVAVNRNLRYWLAPLPIEAPHQNPLFGG